MPYGLLPSGFKAKDLDVISRELRDEIKNNLGANVNTDPDSVIGQLVAIFAAKLSDVWELGENVYQSFNPNAATGDALDNLYSLLGVDRQLSTHSYGHMNFKGGLDAFQYFQGMVFEDSNGELWETDEDFFVVLSATQVKVRIKSVNKGPVLLPDASSPMYPVSSVQHFEFAVNYPVTDVDFVVGQYRETDNEFRNRAKRSLYAQGVGTEKAIEGRLLSLTKPRLRDAKVYTNRGLVANDYGPAKSYQAVIYPLPNIPEDRITIAQELFISQPAGIESEGSSTFTVKDQQGASQSIKYSEAVEVYVDITMGYEHISQAPNAVAGTIIDKTLKDFIDGMKIGESFRDRYALSLCYSNADLFDDTFSFSYRRKSDDVAIPNILFNMIVVVGNITLTDNG